MDCGVGVADVENSMRMTGSGIKSCPPQSVPLTYIAAMNRAMMISKTTHPLRGVCFDCMRPPIAAHDTTRGEVIQ